MTDDSRERARAAARAAVTEPIPVVVVRAAAGDAGGRTPGGTGRREAESPRRRGPRSLAAARNWESAAVVVALVLTVAVGSRLVVAAGVTVGTLLAVALAPVWLSAAAKYRWAGTFLALGALCAITGPVLTTLAEPGHVVDPLLLRENYVRLAELVLGVGALLWARLHLGVRWLAFAYGTGMLIDVVQRGELSFKFGVGLAVSVIVLGWLTPGLRPGRGVWRRVPRTVQAMACVCLGVLFAADDGRSAFAMLLLAAAVVLWQVRIEERSLRRSAWVTVGAVVAAGLAAYGGAQALILDGAFGTAMAQRTAAQIELSGNLLAAGRPEMGATAALIAHRPIGFGPGVPVNGEDLAVAKHGMSQLGYDPENNYVYEYMFGRGIELHSLFGDFWAVYGPAGVLFWVFLLLLVLIALVRRTVRGMADALLVYVAILTAWNLFFSPIYASVPMLILAVVMLLPRWADAVPGAEDQEGIRDTPARP
ncbi:hypothetical protein [Myceligenerans pegani]|uniref:Uncharacterized protein n=1 Tax=Myceligenerans pegani TaxID=2776917 RepID=A0ABR9MV29_9MICO|nr:hypothetical protein [Myceligenerans sp. TRM 65318]MBE1874779.1 hypothetical protein [Myceligenerans sp. TRM 65318]MBE3017050.1 hypothetical protein [Myceligenerans sp. TRM 65318]